MAELSVEEAQRLARQFLTGLAGDADGGRLESVLAEDQTLALELLAQMQSALEDVAPEGLTQEQVKSVDARVEALVGPRIRRRGFFGVFKRLFKRRRKPVPARVARRANAPDPVETPAPAPAPMVESPLLPDGEGMEEMAPIAAAPLPSEALAHMEGLDTSPAPAPAPKPAAPVPAAAAEPSGAGFPWLALGGAVLVLGLLGLGGSWAWARFRNRQAPRPLQAALAAPTPVRGPVPTPAPKGPAPARRDVVLATKNQFDTLPAALPPTTPQSAGQLP